MATKKSATKKAAKKVAVKKPHKARTKPEVPPINFDALTDKEHSISPELSERIAEERESHRAVKCQHAWKAVAHDLFICAKCGAEVSGAKSVELFDKLLVGELPIARPTFDTLVDEKHSITAEQAEQIAEERKSHEDERPPNAKLDVPEIIARAWESVKGAGDPPLDQCVPSHVDKFYTHGQRILAGSSPLGGDTMLARFEQRVSELMRVQ